MALTCAAMAAWAALALAPAAAGAADITVTSNLDDGTDCTLREAISSANTGSATGCANGDAGGTDEITFDPAQFPPGGAVETITLNSSAPQITSDLAIEGYGMNQLTVVHGAGLGRVFFVSDTGTAEISGMTITGGEPALDGANAFGGGIRNAGSLTLDGVCVCGNSAVTSSAAGTTVAAQGGGVYSLGSGAGDQTTIMNSIVDDNDATATQSAASADNASAAGGGIYVEDEPLTIVNSTISNNEDIATKANGTGTASAFGGGVFVRDGAMSVRGSTVNGNRVDAESPGGATATGGGILLIGGGQDSLELSTVADNRTEATAGGTATEQGGGLSMVSTGDPFTITSSTIARNGTASAVLTGGKNIAAGGNPTQIRNSIVSDPAGGGGNCRLGDPITSLGFSGDYTPTAGHQGTCGFGAGTNTTANPLLDPAGLAPNGGSTHTIALRPGSPMIDRGSNAGQSTPNVDQRGSLRPFDVAAAADADNGTDIGAFEYQFQFEPAPPVAPTPSPAPTATGARAAALKKCKKKAKKKDWSKKKRKKCRKRARKLPV